MCFYRLIFFFFAALLSVSAEESGFDRWYSSAAAGVFLPGGGQSLSRAAEVNLRLGRNLTETFAIELEGNAVPNAVSSSAGNQTLAGASVRGVWRFWGYERLDPFLSFGASSLFGSRAVFADDSHRTAFGPTIGFGALYHLTERLSLRADTRALLTVDTPAGVVFGVSVGVQYGFGGDGKSRAAFASPDIERPNETVFIMPKDEAAVLAALRSSPAVTARIEGHVDCRLGMGAKRARTLSEASAAAVRDHFTAAGIAPERLETAGMGFSRPRVKFDFKNGAPENNRVEIRLRRAGE